MAEKERRMKKKRQQMEMQQQLALQVRYNCCKDHRMVNANIEHDYDITSIDS